jgi:hypothetical protein
MVPLMVVQRVGYDCADRACFHMQSAHIHRSGLITIEPNPSSPRSRQLKHNQFRCIRIKSNPASAIVIDDAFINVAKTAEGPVTNIFTRPLRVSSAGVRSPHTRQSSLAANPNAPSHQLVSYATQCIHNPSRYLSETLVA